MTTNCLSIKCKCAVKQTRPDSRWSHICRLHNLHFWIFFVETLVWRIAGNVDSNIIIVSSPWNILQSCLLQRNETRWNVRWKLQGFWLHEICKHSSGGLIIGYVNMIGISHFRVGQTFLSWKNTTDFKRRKKNRTPVFIFLALCLN
jgi:hypothetical protein